MDERRVEQVLRQGPPFATAYAARPLELDAATERPHPSTARLTLVFLTVTLLLATALAVLVALALLRASDPGPVVIYRHNDVWLHPTDGSPERQILAGAPDGHGGRCPEPVGTVHTCGPGGLIQHLTMSPDGRRIVLSVLQLPFPYQSSNLFVLNADGSGLRLVHHEPTGQVNFALAPDGHRLAYVAGLPQAHGTRMRILDLDSGEEIDLPDGGMPMIWSPDGEHIAYVPERDPATGDETWIVDSSGKNPRFLGNYHPLAWTADSRSLFVTRSFGVPDVPPELVAIGDTASPSQTWALGVTDSLAPSPDGRTVAIVQTADQPGQIRIVLADLDGSDPVVVSTIMADRAQVCWSADGRWLFWLLGRDGSPEAEFFAYDLVEADTRMLAHSHTTSERAIYATGCG